MVIAFGRTAPLGLEDAAQGGGRTAERRIADRMRHDRRAAVLENRERALGVSGNVEQAHCARSAWLTRLFHKRLPLGQVQSRP